MTKHLQDQPAAVFRSILLQTAEDMHDIADRLREAAADELLRAQQRSVLVILDQLIASMMTGSRKLTRPSEEGQGTGDDGRPDEPPEGDLRLLNPVNELKMLKLLQLGILSETVRAERLQKEGKREQAEALREKVFKKQERVSKLIQEVQAGDFDLYSREGAQ